MHITLVKDTAQAALLFVGNDLVANRENLACSNSAFDEMANSMAKALGLSLRTYHYDVLPSGFVLSDVSAGADLDDISSMSLIDVRHCFTYGEGFLPTMTHQLALMDCRQNSGQVFIDIGALEGSFSETMSVTVEVNTNPFDGVTHVPCVHVHFDEDNVAFSLFKLNDRILLNPETNVTISETSISNNSRFKQCYLVE